MTSLSVGRIRPMSCSQVEVLPLASVAVHFRVMILVRPEAQFWFVSLSIQLKVTDWQSVKPGNAVPIPSVFWRYCGVTLGVLHGISKLRQSMIGPKTAWLPALGLIVPDLPEVMAINHLTFMKMYKRP